MASVETKDKFEDEDILDGIFINTTLPNMSYEPTKHKI